MKGKKGQVGNLQAIISVLIVVGILIGAGLLIMQEFVDQDSLVDTSATIVNETGLYLNSSIGNSSVARATTVPGFNTFAVTACYANVTGASVMVIAVVPNSTIAVANYTVDTVQGSIVNATEDVHDDVGCTYTYLGGQNAFTSVNDTLTAMTTIPDLLRLIILIAVIGIILAVVFNVIPGARVSGA